MAKGYSGGGMNRNQMMAQARKMQEQLLKAQEDVAKTEVSSSAGGGAVKITATGAMRLTSITLDPAAVDPEDVEFLQDMIMTAVNDALEKAESVTSQQLGAITGGLSIPGLF